MDYLFSLVERLRALAESGVSLPAALPNGLLAQRKQVEQAALQADAALDDDLNTPVALAALGEMARLGHELADSAQKRKKDAAFGAGAALLARELLAGVERLGEELGLLYSVPVDYRARTRAKRLALRGLSAASIEAKVAARTAARHAKDFAAGDAIRDELVALGISLHDGVGGTAWNVEQ